MSGVLDVLRRMQHTCDLDRRDNQIDGLANLDAELAGEESEAIAAIAELIASLKDNDTGCSCAGCERTRAALAKVEGAKP